MGRSTTVLQYLTTRRYRLPNPPITNLAPVHKRRKTSNIVTINTKSEYSLPFTLNNSELLREHSYIDAKRVEAKSGKRFAVIDPGSAYRAFYKYSKISPRKRAQLLLKWHKLIAVSKDDLTIILTYETGKPLAESHGELDLSLSFVWWYAGEAERIQGDLYIPANTSRRVLTVKQPIGVAVGLVPWKFPVAMVLRKAGAVFAARCLIVFKTSPETPLTCLALSYLASKAGFLPGVFNVLTTSLQSTPSLSEALMLHPLVKKVTFTGSTRVGKLVASLCAKGLKKCTLESGGNCPFIVFDDADLEQLVYVQAGVYDEFAALLIAKTKELKVGHGCGRSEERSNSSTLAFGTGKAHNLALTDEVAGLSEPTSGYFFDPTVLINAKQGSLISQEETFGPVLGLFKFETEQQVAEWANSTSMGLASYAFTKNVDRLFRMLENLEAGMIGLNTDNSSAAESPFGGIKEKDKDGNVIGRLLIPRPTNDPKDPLTWSVWRKHMAFAGISFSVFLSNYSLTALTPGLTKVIERFDVSTTQSSYLITMQVLLGLGVRIKDAMY
ncbi:uncharacterized protein PV07_09683 [Cladophialophora immunda]|uniref:Aldehyde dehydrogenase domain-containing protein n=1 Tax=Cladophialophora immunda TaxID=569365 RepID=A0A0D1Z8F7_9EURO|nr:uncharacterized protein PV07_09683 [Cladophialophora immunda]KIW23936.1 hypothetical protein PV07_09683 [Cladophialophora immunda]